MISELIVEPIGGRVHGETMDADSWVSYVAELRKLLGAVIGKSGADLLEVSELLVSEPLSEGNLGLCNGLHVHSSEAIGLIEGMVAGRGPYCRLSIHGKILIESGWDGAIHIFMTRVMAADLIGLNFRNLLLRWRDATPDFMAASKPIDDVAGESFWSAVAEASRGFTLLCERWAYGAYGCRWFRVTRENVGEISLLVRPRSLVCVVGDPELRPSPDLLEDDFTAFVAPLLPGELIYRSYPGGADSLSEVFAEGFSLMLADRVMDNWRAVVPDLDGVIRVQWGVLG